DGTGECAGAPRCGGGRKCPSRETGRAYRRRNSLRYHRNHPLLVENRADSYKKTVALAEPQLNATKCAISFLIERTPSTLCGTSLRFWSSPEWVAFPPQRANWPSHPRW